VIHIAVSVFTVLVGLHEEHSACKKLVIRCCCGYLLWSEVQRICIWSRWYHCHSIISCLS